MRFAPAPPSAPKLLPENEAAWEIWESCQSQVIVAGLGGVVGVSHESLPWKMALRGFTPEEQLEIEEKFRVIEAVFVKNANRRAEETARQRQTKGDRSRG